MGFFGYAIEATLVVDVLPFALSRLSSFFIGIAVAVRIFGIAVALQIFGVAVAVQMFGIAVALQIFAIHPSVGHCTTVRWRSHMWSTGRRDIEHQSAGYHTLL